MTVTVPRMATSPSTDPVVTKSRRYAIYVALALLSITVVILIISASHPVSSDDVGLLGAFPP